MEWDGVGRPVGGVGVGWDGMGWDGTGRDGIQRDGMGYDEVGWGVICIDKDERVLLKCGKGKGR